MTPERPRGVCPDCWQVSVRAMAQPDIETAAAMHSTCLDRLLRSGDEEHQLVLGPLPVLVDVVPDARTIEGADQLEPA